jgi:hypothetical protein
MPLFPWRQYIYHGVINILEMVKNGIKLDLDCEDPFVGVSIVRI